MELKIEKYFRNTSTPDTTIIRIRKFIKPQTTTMSIEPIFTRYLYDLVSVKWSLECALLDGEVEEAFYDVWGLEPDEQCVEMHNWHGVYLESG